MLSEPQHNRPARILSTEVVVETQLVDLGAGLQDREGFGAGACDGPGVVGRVTDVITSSQRRSSTPRSAMCRTGMLSDSHSGQSADRGSLIHCPYFGAMSGFYDRISL